MSIVAQVQIILNDTGVFWPTATVLDAVNEAQFQVYAETKWGISTATLTLAPNADVVTIPSTILIPKWIEGTNSAVQPPVVNRFFISTQRSLEAYSRTWKGGPIGQPSVFILWDATHLRCFPRPDVAYTYTLFGIGFPTEITDTVGDIAGPPNFTQLIQAYSVALLLEATRPDLADMYMAQAEAGILAFKKRLRNNMSHNIRQLVPVSTPFEIKQSGSILNNNTTQWR